MADLIDISHWQGSINWSTVAGTVRKAYIKASEHVAWVDGRFVENWRNAKAAGIQRGAYHFFRANYSGLRQAVHFVRTIGPDFGELAPAIDVETGDGVDRNILTLELNRCLVELESMTDIHPIIYSSAAMWSAYTTQPIWANQYEWWLADYRTGRTAPALPLHVSTYKYWQYTSSGRVPGIIGNVDLNRERVPNVPPPPTPADPLAIGIAAIERAVAEIRGEL